MWHRGLAHLMERDQWGRRCLFISPSAWFQGFHTDPAFQHFVPLAAIRAGYVVRELVANDRRLLWRLYELSQRSRLCETPDAYQTTSFLIRHILDGTCISWRLPAGRPSHFCLLREEPLPIQVPTRRPFQEKEPFKPAPLAATNAWIAVQCVDDSEQQRPLRRVRLELTTAAGEVRSEFTDDSGTALVTGIAPGRVIIRVLDLDGSKWRPLEGEASQPSTAEPRTTWHTVGPGECMSKIAHQYGLKGWKELWEHPKNEALRSKRRSPHVLLPGDEVAVPAVNIYELARQTDATHRIEVKADAKLWLRLVLLDEAQEPIEQGTYAIQIEGAPYAEGSIEKGKVECAVPMSVRDVVLVARVGDRTIERTLDIGALDPVDALSGVQGRLSNLGHYDGELADEPSETLAFALREFREAAGLAATDELDEELHRALEREHRA